MESTWQLQEAQNQLDTVIERAIAGEMQTITRDGEPTVMVLSVAEFEKIRPRKNSLVEFFESLPMRGIELNLERNSPAQEFDL